ncbi:ABC transporter permease [Patescibacteria group bacterium]|nr:MAG: ABC transporter permease [Patescibacteria group bacterium]
MRGYLFTISQLTKLLVRRYFRSRIAIFFSVFFPLLLLFVFGFLYSNNKDVSFKVALFNNSNTEFAKQFATNLDQVKALSIQKDLTDMDAAKEKMNRSEIDAIIELPPEFGQINSQNFPSGQVKVLYSQNSQQAGQTIGSVLQGILDGVNVQLTKIQPPLTVKAESTADQGLTAFDYAFPGLIGFSLLGLGIFGPLNMLPAEKKTGALTRLRVTPLRPSQFIISYMFSSLATGVLSITAMFLVAITLFEFHLVGNLLVFALFTIFGAIMIFGIGVGVGGWASDEKQAAPLGNIITFPMMFLSGIFFPRYLMPEWLQGVTQFIPLTPVIDGMRLILTEGKTFIDLGPQLGLMAIWTVVVYTIAFRVFRWD